ncbi:MAG: MaoC family dehydratase [Candidatus Eremiobacteraeota bacterium]|nr:MaoC family dehydratase [Candidatus Eremiobacteraeota bacterium]
MSWDTLGYCFERRVLWSAADIARFARDVGDENPLHHDDAFALSTRFKGLIASGAQPVAILMAMCGSQATKEKPGVGLEFNFRLLGPARVDEEIVFRWQVMNVERSERPKGTLVVLHGEAVGVDGRPIVTATAKTLVLPDGA